MLPLQALISKLQDSKKHLKQLCDDPLETARADARGAKGGQGGTAGAGASGSMIISKHPKDKGRQKHFSSDEEDHDPEKFKVKAPDTSFKPRRDILADIPACLSLCLLSA